MFRSDVGKRKASGVNLAIAFAALASALVLIFGSALSQAQSFTVLHNFTGAGDGANPVGGLIADRAGRLYGSTSGVFSGYGSVYRTNEVGSNWLFNPLYDFGPGNLYGTASTEGPAGSGTVFELSPSGGGWTYTVLYSFPADGYPQGNLVMDSAGSLYGVAGGCGRYREGCVWKLTRSGNGWMFTSLYDFTGRGDGWGPVGGPALDASGNLFGTTEYGGLQDPACPHGCGVVWEITR